MGHRSSTLTRDYTVKSDVEITVTNVVGQEQPGSWSMTLDGEVLASGSGQQTITVGIGGDLAFRELRVYFVIQEHSRQHQRLTATTIVTGGEETIEITHEQQGETGDSATYTTLVQFVL
jgi:hypothetical protein